MKAKQVKETMETVKTVVAVELPESARAHDVMAEKLRRVLASDKVSREVKVTFEDFIVHAATEAKVWVYHPALVAAAFPLIMDALEGDYGRATLDTGYLLLESPIIPDSLAEEFEEYDAARFKGLGRHLPSELDFPAEQLSALMNDPRLPRRIRNVLADELTWTPEGASEGAPDDGEEFTFARVLRSLEILSEKEGSHGV